MTEVKRPTKQQLREYLYKRHESKDPPPTPDEARRELGWQLVPDSKQYNHDD